MALPAPFMRSIARPASGWREVKPRLPSRFRRLPRRASAPTCRSPARRAARPPRASPHPRLARRRRARRLPPPRKGPARRGACVARGQGALPEGDLVDASPAKMRVHPVDDHRGAVLRLEREGAFDPQHQGCGNGRRVGIAFARPRRPFELDRPGVARERLADNGRPVGDQARLAQAARGQRLGDQPGREFSQRAWRRRGQRFIIASALNARTGGARSMA